MSFKRGNFVQTRYDHYVSHIFNIIANSNLWQCLEFFFGRSFYIHQLYLKLKAMRTEKNKWTTLKGSMHTCQYTPSATLLLEAILKAGYNTHPSPNQHFFCWCSKPHKAVMLTPKIHLDVWNRNFYNHDIRAILGWQLIRQNLLSTSKYVGLSWFVIC